MIKIGVPLINGVSYTQGDVILELLGVPIVGVTSISYSDKQAITGNYSTGNEVTSVGFGEVENLASITLTLEEVNRIHLVIGKGKLQNIPFFDINILFVRQEDPTQIISHRLVKCKFMGTDFTSETNNSQIEIPLELFVSKIEYTR